MRAEDSKAAAPRASRRDPGAAKLALAANAGVDHAGTTVDAGGRQRPPMTVEQALCRPVLYRRRLPSLLTQLPETNMAIAGGHAPGGSVEMMIVTPRTPIADIVMRPRPTRRISDSCESKLNSSKRSSTK